MHAVTAGLHLAGEGLLGDGQRIGVRHFEHRGDAAHHRAARTGFQVFLVGQARLAKMHLRVDHAGQDVQALAVDHLGGRGLSERADRSDAAIGDGDVAHALAVLIDHGAGFQNGIKSLTHRFLSARLTQLDVAEALFAIP